METAEHKLVDAAKAIGLKPGTVRSWLNRGQVLLNNQPAQAWGRILLTDGDVLFCTLVAELTKYGVPVEQAFRMVRAAGDEVKAELEPDEDFIFQMLEKVLMVWTEDGQWNCSAWSEPAPADRRSFLVVPVARCAMPVFEKLWPGTGSAE